MDEIDRAIIDALQKNGRQKHNELAKRLNIAHSTVSERVRRMESQGLIKGYRAVIDHAKLGLQVQAFVSIRVARHNQKILERLEEQIRNVPHVQACYHVTGRYDYLIHVVAADLDELGRLVKNVISDLPGFVTPETFVIYSDIKSGARLPINGAP